MAPRTTTGITTAMAAISPVERPLWEDDEVEGMTEDVADEEEFVVVFDGCWGMVWLNGMRKLECALLDSWAAWRCAEWKL